MKKHNRKALILKVLKVIFIILILVSLINLLIWYLESNKTKKIIDNTNKYLIVKDKKYRLKEEIKTVNEEIIGWLKVDNTNINYPIVQTNNNKYYLNHDLEKNYNSAGWIFMDSENKLDDQNIVIYGHHRRDGIMFGSIDNLLNNNKGGKIHLIIGGKTIDFNIFSIYKTEKEYNYRNRNYRNFNKKIQEFKNNSLIDYKVDIKNKDQIITLSTCDNDNKNRIVVQGIKIN